MFRNDSLESFSTFEIKPDVKGNVMIVEGQHIQRVVPTARRFGGPCTYAITKTTYEGRGPFLDDDDVRETDFELILQWSRHWDTSKRVLVEKSPNDIVRSRWLDAIFGTVGRTAFVFTIRHPLAIYEAHCAGKYKTDVYLDNWLAQVERLQTDVSFLSNVVVLRYEDWATDDETAWSTYDELTRRLGLRRYPRRKLMYYHGHFDDVHIQSDSTTSWAPIVDEQIVRRFERRVNVYGYSLISHEVATMADLGDAYPFLPYAIAPL